MEQTHFQLSTLRSLINHRILKQKLHSEKKGEEWELDGTGENAFNYSLSSLISASYRMTSRLDAASQLTFFIAFMGKVGWKDSFPLA